MKNLKRISYIVISLILFQSFSAVANSLDFHAIDIQHLQHEHKHSEHEQVQSELSANETSDKVSTEHHNPAVATIAATAMAHMHNGSVRVISTV